MNQHLFVTSRWAKSVLRLGLVALVVMLLGAIAVSSAWAVQPGQTFRYDNYNPAPIPPGWWISPPVNVVGLTGPIQKVTVSLYLTHPFLDDLYVYLQGPDGTTAMLANYYAGAGYGVALDPDGARTTFDDAGAPLFTGFPNYVGTFQPDQLLGPRFNGKDGGGLNGVWTLNVVDTMGRGAGMLEGWSLMIEVPGGQVATQLSDPTASQTVTNLGARVTLGSVLSDGQSPIPDRTDVELWSGPDGQTWNQTGTAAWNAGSGAYEATRPISVPTWYRFGFPGDAGFGASQSNPVLVTPQVYLTRPSIRLTRVISRRGRGARRIAGTGTTYIYNISGYLKPLHAGTTQIQFSRWDGDGWSPDHTEEAANVRFNAYISRYVLNTQLSPGIRWRIQAYFPGDSDHAATLSAPTYFYIPARLLSLIR